MRRRTPLADRVPTDLRTYDANRWVLAVHGDTYSRHIPAGWRPTHWSIRHLRAPEAYRQALVEAVGHELGNAHFDSTDTGGRAGYAANCPCEFCSSSDLPGRDPGKPRRRRTPTLAGGDDGPGQPPNDRPGGRWLAPGCVPDRQAAVLEGDGAGGRDISSPPERTLNG